ncbi:MAG: copper resistance protein NlpE N-terminal domain-containing protein [Elusimicrobiota bacterium]|jgi:copper homeostasis protein (lipoprotein)|nr:copper resistance protein NlpE N-terminal domain-containing protein [Elusimicrobiota bacterium]
MKIRLSLLFFLTAFICACGNNAGAPQEESLNEAQLRAQQYFGAYEGLMPCADCAGIDTELTLNSDNTFTLIEHYQDETGELFLTEGIWELNGGLTYAKLQNSQDGQTLFYRLTDAGLEKLDYNAKPIKSNLNYTLKRK